MGIYTIPVAYSIWFVGLFNKFTKAKYYIAQSWTIPWMWAARSKVTLIKNYDYKKNQPYVVISNHLSNLDPMMQFRYLKIKWVFMAKKEVYKRILPILAYMGKDIMHCGDVGTGQMTKILNNMILFETVVALSEAANIAEKYDMSVKNLFENITKCSGDSFALRNHGLKSIAQNHFPSPAFSSEYALKDLSYAINLGKTHNLNLPGANSAKKLLKKSIMNGDKDLYFPVIKKHFG